MAVLPTANFEVLASPRNPKPPYFANQSGTVFKVKWSQRVDVLMKVLQFLDLHGGALPFTSAVLPTFRSLAYHPEF